MKTYFIQMPTAYRDHPSSTRDKTLSMMCIAFGTSRAVLLDAISKTPIKVSAEQLGDYIAERSMSGLGNAVAELMISDSPNNYLDLTRT
jgi:hypothetical protein